MKNAFLALLASTFVAAVTPDAKAATPADPYGRGNWSKLLQNKANQKSLKLTADQITQLAAVKPGNRDAMAKVLQADQLKTLKRIAWRDLGGYALFDVEVAKLLKVTAAQRKQLEDVAKVNAEQHGKMRSFLRRARFRSRAAMQKYIDGYKSKADRALLAVLTAAQAKRHKQLIAAG